MYDPNPDDSQRQRSCEPASCPVQAILVERLDDTEEGNVMSTSTDGRERWSRPW